MQTIWPFLVHIVLAYSNYFRYAHNMILNMTLNAVNAKKSNVMIVRSREDKQNNTFPVFYLCNSPRVVWKEVKYLDHTISSDFSDYKGIYHQRRKLYAQANMLLS